MSNSIYHRLGEVSIRHKKEGGLVQESPRCRHLVGRLLVLSAYSHASKVRMLHAGVIDKSSDRSTNDIKVSSLNFCEHSQLVSIGVVVK